MCTLHITDFEENLMTELSNAVRDRKRWKLEKKGIRCRKEEDNTVSADVYHYGEGKIISICPEPLTFIKEYRDIANDRSETEKRFRSRKEGFQKICLDYEPRLKTGAPMWLNKTTEGINLRPGKCMNDLDNEYRPVTLGDECVHGVVVGRTGGGKSVFLNALILGILSEYAPWEIDLYLADFKRVELSRYMNDEHEQNRYVKFTPHVNVCAATGEITYVVSLLHHLVDCMQARNQFFMQLGVTKLQEFRDTYGVVLPRVLLIVDEFQQMFVDIPEKKRIEINMMIKMISKLGRATGFHLLFSSQDMSGTGLFGNVMGNFKLRIALPCENSIASEILGSGNDIQSIEVGQVLINADEKGLKYKVPYAKADEEKSEDTSSATRVEFYDYLDWIKVQGTFYQEELTYKFNKQKFYREEIQEKEEDYLMDLDAIKEQKCRFIKGSGYYDAVVLGYMTEHTERANDKAVLYMEKGRNCGILICSNSNEANARMLKLLIENFVRDEGEVRYLSLEMNPVVAGFYTVSDTLNKYEIPEDVQSGCGTIEEKAFFKLMQFTYYIRMNDKVYFNSESSMSKRNKSIQDLAALESEWADESKRSEYFLYLQENAEQKSELTIHKKTVMDLFNKFITKMDKMQVQFAENYTAEIGYSTLDTYAKIIKEVCPIEDLADYFNNLSNVIKTCIESNQELTRKAEDADEIAKGKLNHIRYTILREAVLFFNAMYQGKFRPEQAPCQSEFMAGFQEFEEEMCDYREWHEKFTKPNSTVHLIQELYMDIEQYLIKCYEDLPTKYYKMPNVELKMGADKISIEIDENADWVSDEIGREINNQYYRELKSLLDSYFERLSGTSDFRYPRSIFCTNGMDYLDSIPDEENIKEIVRNGAVVNILNIMMTNSDQVPIIPPRCFDYVLIMGHVKSYYVRMDIPYFPKEADSFVVSLYVRSKDKLIPFKMYDSELREAKMSTEIEDFLESAKKLRNEKTAQSIFA